VLHQFIEISHCGALVLISSKLTTHTIYMQNLF